MASQEVDYARLFLAIPVKGRCGQYLQRLCANLKPLFGAGQVNWTPVENLHLTLHYFGKVSGREYVVIQRIIDGLLAGRLSFDLTFSEIVLFPRPSRPRLIACEVVASATLGQLVTDLRAEMARAGFLIEARPFRAHVTLGRLKRIPKDREAVDRMSQWLEKECARLQLETDHSLTVNEIALYNSVTEPGGAVYDVIKRWRLQD